MTELTNSKIIDNNQRYNDFAFKTASYTDQLAQKERQLNFLLSEFYQHQLDVFSSPAEHYRMRAEFRVWHAGADTYHIMFDQQTKAQYQVDQLPAASKIINLAMKNMIERVKQTPVLRTKLFQIDYLSTTSNEIVISMLYHKRLDEEWQLAAQNLRDYLSSIKQFSVVNIIGRAKKQKVVIGNDYATELLTINHNTFSFKQIENSFTQPNAHINVKMIEWVIQNNTSQQSDLLELYCGAGNFSVPLARHYKKVLATEISKTSVAAAQQNISTNKVSNLKIARLSSEEFVEAYNKTRSFNRLANIDLADYDFRTVLVDPPRAGLDTETLSLIANFETIIYISCNPSTLVENLAILSQTHKVIKVALFDQFPFTSHMESGVILQKK